MREIKFRGKRVDNSKWVYGYIIKWDGKSHIYEDTGDLLQKAVEVHQKTVGQFTGLKDSKNCDLYEGDIVLAREQNNISKKKHKQEVIFYYGGFRLAMLPNKIRLRNISAPLIENDVEKIGNIYSNPGLVKQ